MHLKIFIVEDDPWYGELLKYHLTANEEYEVFLYQTAKECLNNLHLSPNIICIDFGLPDMKGDVLLSKIKSRNNSIPIIVISGQEEISVAVELLKSGASDYIIKNDNTKELLWNSILKIKENIDLKQEVENLKEEIGKKYVFQNNIHGQSPAIKKTFTLIEKAIKSSINISIFGETGTGKEVVAKAIHYSGALKNKPFVAVNMAAIPSELIESELFGYEKGAFTGASGMKIGKFEEANGGTIFLDEIAELNLNLQSKILRVLQEREVVRLGGNKHISLDFRLITATHKDLQKEVMNGRFREDLFYRIMGLPIMLPPLRERGNDILILAKYFSDEFARENKCEKFIFSDEAKNKLLTYHFPGNVRELKAIVDLACVMTDTNCIEERDITFTSINHSNSFLQYNSNKTLKVFIAEIIQHYIKTYNNDILEVAQRLDIGKSTIYNMLKSGEIVKD